jgi:hypothetical protein
MKNYNILLVFTLLIISFSCRKDKIEEENNNELPPITIDAQEHFKFGTEIKSFDISDDGNLIFFISSKLAFRYNKSSNQLDTIYKYPGNEHTPHFLYINRTKSNNKLYITYYYESKGRIVISEDNGDTWTMHETATMTNTAANWYTGAFVKRFLGKMHETSDGTLILPETDYNGVTYAISNDGGVTWTAKSSNKNSFIISANKSDKLYSLTRSTPNGLGGTNTSNIYYSEDKGETWIAFEGKTPSIFDNNNAPIHVSNHSFEKLIGDKWQEYKLSNTAIWLSQAVNSDGGSYNSQGVRLYTRNYTYLHFDNQNNLYFLSNRTIYKTKLQ